MTIPTMKTRICHSQELRKFPAKIVNPNVIQNPLLQIYFGDTDGDVLLVIENLIAYGILEVTPNEYAELVTICENAHNLSSAQIKKFTEILSNIARYNPCAGIFFAGDTRSERTGNDALTSILDNVFNQLKKEGIIGDFAHTIGNHDKLFLDALKKENNIQKLLTYQKKLKDLSIENLKTKYPVPFHNLEVNKDFLSYILADKKITAYHFKSEEELTYYLIQQKYIIYNSRSNCFYYDFNQLKIDTLAAIDNLVRKSQTNPFESIAAHPGFNSLKNCFIRSTLNMKQLIENKIISVDHITQSINQFYLPNLKLIHYTISYSPQSNLSTKREKITLLTHAPTGFNVIRDIADLFEIDYQDNSASDLGNTIDKINRYFYIHFYDKNIQDKIEKAINMVSTNRDITNLERNPTHSNNYYDMDYIHGHTDTDDKTPSNVLNLNPFKHKNYLVSSAQASLSHQPHLKKILKKYFKKQTDKIIHQFQQHSEAIHSEKRKDKGKAKLNEVLSRELHYVSRDFYNKLDDPQLDFGNPTHVNNFENDLNKFSSRFTGAIDEIKFALGIHDKIWKVVWANIALAIFIIFGKAPYAGIARLSGYDKNASPFFFNKTRSFQIGEESTYKILDLTQTMKNTLKLK